MPKSKKGGGVRVKRLMMYEKGMDGASPVLYGSRYDYNFWDPLTNTYRSSGVATNEPGAIHEENILVDLLHQNADEQSAFNKVIAGRDKAQLEGPLGESIYPSASIGYSRVTVSNIHSGKTGTGFTVNKFYTARDYPVVERHTDIKDKKIYRPLIFGLVNNYKNNSYASQGYSFILNNMHGQIKSITTYSGDAIDETSTTPILEQLQKAVPVTFQKYEYYLPGRMSGDTYLEGEKIPVMSDETQGVQMLNPGKVADVTFAQKAVKDELYAPSIEVDGDVGYVPPFLFIPFVTGVPYFTHTESDLFTHVTSKVIRYPAVVKRIITKQDGIEHTNETVAFDKYTGKPVVQKSYDDFAGTYIKQSIPASWKYDNMKPISLNQKKKIACSYTKDGDDEFLQFSGSNCDNLDLLVRGDLLELGEGILYYVKAFDYFNSRVKIVPSSLSTGTPGDISSVRIFRSGHTNQLTQKAGEITYHVTDHTVALPSATDPNRWISQGDGAPQSPFLQDLNDAVGSITDNSDEGTINLPGTYSKMDVSIYLSEFPDECAGLNAESTAISNVKVYYYNREGRIDFQILSFTLDCNGSNVTVQSHRTL